MSNLYTTLTHVKEHVTGTLNGLPPVMMDLSTVPAKWRARIDPMQVLGLGGLIEDEQLGLRCPIVGCTEWRHTLARHLQSAHGMTADDLKDALSLPRSIGLTSSASHERFQARAVPSTAYSSEHKRKRKHSRGGKKNRGRKIAMGVRNARQRCLAQLDDRIRRLAAEIGHSPTQREAIVGMGHATFRAIVRAFGSWNQALISCELPIRKRVAHTLTRAIVIEAWANFYRENHRYPSLSEAASGLASPIVPSATATMRVMKVKHWASVARGVARNGEKRERKLKLVKVA